MSRQRGHKSPGEDKLRLLLPYVADLELEVDRLRRQGRFIAEEARAALKQIRQTCADGAEADGPDGPLARIDATADGLRQVLRDMQESPGYHPSHDQVVAIAVRPLFEQVFRMQQ